MEYIALHVTAAHCDKVVQSTPANWVQAKLISLPSKLKTIFVAQYAFK